MDDSYNNTMSDDLPDLTTAQVKVPKQPRVKTQGDSTVATVVDDELSKLGWSDNARLSFLGDLGRENAWNRKTIFGGHSDPKSQAFNRGIISWQGDRRTNLDNFLKKEGVLGKNDDNELRSMVRFADQEMQNSPEWKSIAKKMRDPKISTYDASENLRKYIKYVPDGPYNSHDPEFRVKNNAQWAKQARKLGLGQLPDLSGAQGLPDLQNAIAPDDLPDLSSVAVGTDTPTNVIQQPQGQLPSENYTKRDTSQPGNYWNFETTGKAGDLDYLGMAGDKHLAKNKDGDTYEFDETAKAFRPTNPLTNRLKFEGGRELTKKKDDIYVDADNDEYKVTATPGKDGGYEYKRTPVNPYTKTVQLNDGTVLTRDAQIKGGFRYRAEDGTPYIYTTKGIRQANPPNWVNGKARPDTVQLPDARKTAYEEFRQSHNLKDSGELRKDWLRRDQLVAAGKQDDPYSQQEIDALSQLKTGTQVMPQQVEKAAQGPVARAALKPNELANIGQLPGIVPNQDLRADILKTDNGTAIKKVTNDPSYGVSPPEGFERFVDGNDQTYLVNTETGELKDESLAEIADRFKVKKVPFNMRGSVSVEDAQKRMAFQVADQIGAKYNLDKNDVYNYLLRKKLTDVGTDNRISESNLYETEEDARRANDRYNASSIGMPGQEGPSGTESTNSLTGRQLQDLLREVPAQTDAKERYALDRIVQGAISPNPSRAELEDLGVNLARLRQHPDFYAASKKGEQAQANIQRLTADLQQGGQFDEFSAPIESRAQLGIISREAANAELSAYKKTLDEKLAANGYLINATPQGVQGMSGRSVAMAGGMEPESQAVRQQRIQDWTHKQLQDDLRKNGTFAKYQESLAQAQMEEAARQQRMANEPLLDKINNRLMAVTLGPTKAAISGVASALQGFPIWTKPVADYIDSLGPNGKALATILSPILMGMRGMGGRDKASSIQQNPMYRAGGWMKETAQAALPTNKDYDKSFWWGSVPQGIGSSFAFMPAAIGGPVGISLFASMQMTGDAFDEGIQTGASESDSAKYARINGAMFGWTETVGFGNIFQRMLKGPAAATWKKLVLEAIKESGEEVFLNEGPQSIGSDVLARLTIDPNRKWDASVMESMGAAGVSAPLVSVLISGLLHLKHSRQIKRVAKQDLLNGGPNVRDFGEEHGFYVFGKPVEETEDVKPLLERHRALQKELNDGFDQIKDIEAKYPRRTTKSLGMIRNVQGELLRLYQEQTQVADQIREQSGIPAPDILAQKNEAEEARDAAVAEDPAVPVAVPSESTSTEVTNEATNEQVPQPAASVVEDAVLPSGEDTQFDDETQVADDAKPAKPKQPPVEPIDEPIRTLPSRKFARKAEKGFEMKPAESEKAKSIDATPEKGKSYDDYQKEIDAYEDKLEASGRDPVKMYDYGSKPIDLPGYTESPKELTELYAKRDAIDKADVEANVKEIDKQMKPLIPDDTLRNKFVRELAQADLPTALREENQPRKTGTLGSLTKVVNHISRFIDNNIAHDNNSVYSFKAHHTDDAANPKMYLKMLGEPGFEPPKSTLDEIQRFVDHIYGDDIVKIPGADRVKKLGEIDISGKLDGEPVDPQTVIFNKDVIKTAKQAHRESVETALKNGEKVPPSVLKDYPDLVQDTKGSDVPIKAEDVPIEKGFEMKPTDTKPTLPPLTDNYRKPLSEYAPTLYRETNVAQAIDLLSGDSLDAKPFFSNTPNLAKGQGSNKGVTIELNSEGLQGQVNKKPGWEFTYQNGEAEFVGTHNKSYRDNVKSVTIDKASLPKSRRLYQYLEQSGFEKTKNSDGSITFARPRGAETSATGNNGNFDATNTDITFAKSAEITAAAKELEGARTLPDDDIFTEMELDTLINDGDGVGRIDSVDMAVAFERLMADGAFEGFFLDPDQVKDFVATINRYADSVDFDNTDLKAVAKFITDTADERGLIMLWNDDALNEEKAHRVLAEIRTAERAKQVGKEVSDKIVNSDVFKNALNGRFGRNYGNAKQATQVEEFAVKAALGQYDQIGVTAETQREAVGLAADFFESAMATAAKNGKFTREQIADKFASEIAYASQTREEQESRVVQKETSKTQERDDDLKRSETDKGAEDRRDTGNAEASIIEAPDSLVNYKNRKHAEYLREHGLDAEDVPYIPETERGWQLKGREIVNDSLAAKGDYSDAIAEFNNPTKITGGERTALGYELIDRLGAEGDYDAMRKITDGVVIHEGQAGAILRAAQIVGKYDFAKAAEIAQKAVQKKGRSLTDKEISDLRKETAKYAEKEEELATAIQIFEEAKAENERIKADIADMGSSLAEMNERKSVDDKTIASLKRMVSYWKNKKVTTSSPIRSAVYKDLVAKKQANEDILKAKFGGKDITFSKPDSPKAMFTAEERQALVDLTAMAILEHRPYTTLIQNIKDQTGLTDVEVGAIHADAVANLTAKSGQKQSDNVKKALEIRREHKKQAKLFRDGGMVLTRLDREILKNVTDPQEVFATLLWNRSLNPHDFKTQIQKEFPDLKDEDVKRLIRKVGGLRSDAKQSLIRQMAERKSNQTVSDVELKKFQTAKRIAQSRVRQARQSMDTYFRTLQRSLVAKGVDAAMEAVNFLKGTAATGDISYLFRQGLLPLITDTRAAIKADWQGIGHGLQGDNELWAKLAKKAGREDVEQFILEHNVTQFIEKVREHPRHSEAQAMGIRFAEIGDHNIADEHFSSKMLEKIPVYKRLELAYTLPGDLQRLFVYDVWANAIEGQGLNTQQELVAKKYATQVINALTGKGDISKVLAQGGALSKLANVTFFSPSLLISRFQSAYYLTTGFATAPKGMRMMMAKKGMRVWGALALVAYLLGMSFDPDDDDFGKIKVRKDSMLSKAFNTDTKLDVLAGMSTPIQLMFRAAASMTKYAQTGDSGYLSDAASETWQQFGTNKRNEPRFLRGKLSPSASWLVDYGTGTDYIGKPYTHWNAITSRLTPLSWGQAYDAMMYDRADAMMKEPVTQERAKERWNNQDRDMGNALSILLPSIFGIGVNQYPQSEVSPATKKAGDMRDYVSRKDSETIRIEGGLRNLIKEKMDMQGRGENTAQIDNDIKRYATKYAQSLSKLTSQAKSETGLLSFYATGLNVDQLQRVLPLANDAERKVLEKLLDAAKNKPKQKDTPKVSTSTKTEGLPSLKIKGLPSL